jgi:hypothetical protein
MVPVVAVGNAWRAEIVAASTAPRLEAVDLAVLLAGAGRVEQLPTRKKNRIHHFFGMHSVISPQLRIGGVFFGLDFGEIDDHLAARLVALPVVSLLFDLLLDPFPCRSVLESEFGDYATKVVWPGLGDAVLGHAQPEQELSEPLNGS